MPRVHVESPPTAQVGILLTNGRYETITYPAEDERFETFHLIVARTLDDFVSCEIVEVPHGYTVVATRDVKKGENFMVEKAVIAAVVSKGGDNAEGLLRSYIHYRKSDLAPICQPYVAHMAADAAVDEAEVTQLMEAFDRTNASAEGINVDDVMHILTVSRANFYDHLIEYEHPETKKQESVTLTNCYPAISLINHSCAPNVDQEYHIAEVPEHPMTFGSVFMLVTANRNIGRGEEIGISYLDGPLLKLAKDKRRDTLFKSRNFICKCDTCEDRKPGGKKKGWFGLW